MTVARVWIAGSGYVGTRLAGVLRAQGHEVWTLRRRADTNDPQTLCGDLTRPDTLSLPSGLTHVVFCAGLKQAAPAEYEALFVQGITGVLDLLEREPHPIERVLFTSTTGVHHETEGRWIDEDTPPHPARDTARFYQQAEQIVAAGPFPSVVARLSGIYGPGRDRLLRSVRDETARRYPGPARYLNHIHLDDAAGALAHLLLLPRTHPAYLVTDHEPADRNAMLCWIADALRRDHPPWLDESETPPFTRGGNKRCNNHRLLDSGYAFRYPTYREGYASLMGR